MTSTGRENLKLGSNMELQEGKLLVLFIKLHIEIYFVILTT